MKHSEQHPYKTWINLAAARLGAQALACSDDFFAEMENLLKPAAPVFIDDKYTDRGKWMDGWESRRKRVVGHDWCVIKLGAKGIIHGLNVCTKHFAGNAPQKVSIGYWHLVQLMTHSLQWKLFVVRYRTVITFLMYQVMTLTPTSV